MDLLEPALRPAVPVDEPWSSASRDKPALGRAVELASLVLASGRPPRARYARSEVNEVNWYRLKTALGGLRRLAELSEEDKQACVDAYKFFQRMQAGEPSETADETKAVADYYKVLNNMLSVFDLEKLYIPPQLDESQGLYGNQLLVEQAVGCLATTSTRIRLRTRSTGRRNAR